MICDMPIREDEIAKERWEHYVAQKVEEGDIRKERGEVPRQSASEPRDIE